MYISDKYNHIEPSGTLAFTILIQELRAAGRDVIDLAVGQPDFVVDADVTTATAQALKNGHTRYGPVAGLPALRQKLAAEFQGYNPENILVTNGAKQGLFEVFQAICDPGREVIIPSPCWVSFQQQVRLAGGSPVMVDTIRHQIDTEAMARAVTDRTVAILINSPNNPTGAVYAPSALEHVIGICRQNDLWLISDEAYAGFVYGDKPFARLFDFPEIRSQLIVVRSFSKTYGMTGFRIGYVAAPEEMITRLTTVHGHLTGNVCTFAQYGALAAMDTPLAVLEGRRRQFQTRRDLAIQRAGKLFDLMVPEGAFYLFPSVERYRERFGDDKAFAHYLLENANVAVVPGAFFGAPGHIRISFATGAERLIQGFQRIEDVL
jgi:aspartate aminotransferase